MIKHIKLAVPLLLAVLWGAAVHAQEKPPAPAPVPGLPPVAASPAPPAPAATPAGDQAQTGGPPPTRLSLAQAEQIAVKNNPQISEALLNAAAALQVPVQYRSAYFPTVSGNATGVISDRGSRLAAGALNNPVVYDRVAAGLNVTQMVTDFGRTGNLVDMARLRADAQNQAAEQVRADILLVAGQAYFSLLREQAVLRVARQTVAARQLLSDQVTALAQSNLKSQLDVSFANVNLADANLLLIQAENAVKAGEAQLAAVLGLPGDSRFTLAEEPMPAPLPASLEALVLQAMDSRPELRGSKLEQQASEKFARAEHALHYPNIMVMGAAGVVPWTPAGQTQIEDRYGAIGINLNVPIFNGFLFKARESEARLKAQAAQQRVNDLETRVARDVRVAGLNEKSACDRVPVTLQMLTQSQTALDLAESRYSLGLSSIIELSQAQLNLTSAQIGAESARYDCQAQRLNVDYQVGALR